MSLLSASDLAFMQETQEQAMPGTVVIERYGLTQAGQGGALEGWTAAGTVIGRIYPQRTMGMEAVGGAQVQSEMKWWATLPIGTEVSERDRLFYGDSTFEVIRVNTDEMWSTAVRCELSTLNQERRV